MFHLHSLDTSSAKPLTETTSTSRGYRQRSHGFQSTQEVSMYIVIFRGHIWVPKYTGSKYIHSNCQRSPGYQSTQEVSIHIVIFRGHMGTKVRWKVSINIVTLRGHMGSGYPLAGTHYTG